MNPVAIRGIGPVGSFGCGRKALAESLRDGPPKPAEWLIPISGKETILAAHMADTAPLEGFLSRRETRRIDHFSKMALLGAFLALEDGDSFDSPGENMGLILATGYGATRTTFAFLDTVIADGDPFASPTQFSNSVHNAAAAHIAIQLKITGPTLTVSQFEMSVGSALLSAACWLEEGRVSKVLLGAVDELSAVLGYCHHRFFGAPADRIEPFVPDRHTAVPGEGAVFFLLDREKPGRYGTIADIHLARIDRMALLPRGGIYIANADGHPACSSPYQELIPAGAEVAAFTPHFGSLPVGQAFDLAVAWTALRQGVFPAAHGRQKPPAAWRWPKALIESPIRSIKCTGDGELSLISLNGG